MSITPKLYSEGFPWRVALTTKQQAHQLIDQLPPSQLSAVVGLLEAMLEPFEQREISPETVAAMDRARASLARGEGIPHDEVQREFGLKQ